MTGLDQSLAGADVAGTACRPATPTTLPPSAQMNRGETFRHARWSEPHQRETRRPADDPVLVVQNHGMSSYGVILSDIALPTAIPGSARGARTPPQAAIEQRMVERGDVARGIDIGRAGAPNSSTTMPPSSASPARRPVRGCAACRRRRPPCRRIMTAVAAHHARILDGIDNDAEMQCRRRCGAATRHRQRLRVKRCGPWRVAALPGP